MMMTWIRSAALGVLMLLPAPVWAVHPFEVERTDTQGAGNFLLELNGDLKKDDALTTTRLTGAFTAGAGENTDLAVQVPYELFDPSPLTNRFERGAREVRLQLKQRLFENEVKQSMGFVIYTDIPTGYHRDGIGERNLLWGVAVTDQQGCCDTILRVGAGYEVLGRNIKNAHYADGYAIRFGLAAEQQVTASFRLLAELAGESRKAPDREAPAAAYSRPFTFMAGGRYDLSRSWYIDLSGRAGLNRYAEDYTILSGAAFRF